MDECVAHGLNVMMAMVFISDTAALKEVTT
jgi:hypothetical protein